MRTEKKFNFLLCLCHIKFRRFFWLITIIFALTSVNYAAERKGLSFQSLGIETWEDGKKSNTYQQWNLSFTLEHLNLKCWLDQIVFWDCIPRIHETMVFKKSYSTFDNTLIIRNIDLTKGRLDFSIDYKGELSECILLFNPACDSYDCKARSLNCKMIHKSLDGSLQTVEDRLVEKTYYWKPKCGFFMRGTNE